MLEQMKNMMNQLVGFSAFVEFVFHVLDEEQMDTSENPDDSNATDHAATEPDFTENSKPQIYLSKTILMVS